MDEEKKDCCFDGEQLVVDADSDAATTQAEPIDPLVGTMMADRYRVLSLIGSGATSSVYKAQDQRFDRCVAIKVLHQHLVKDAEIVGRFQQEVKTSSILTHPNVIAVHDFNKTASGQPYLVMEYLDGQSLQQMIKNGGGWLPWQRAANMFIQVCAALGAAHEKRIVHRDLKPSNIMITTNADGHDFVKVLDFGIAKVLPVQGETFLKLTQTGETLGSLLYMSPEQCLDQDLDQRSDVYSLGCVMYETLSGKAPLCGRTAFETMNYHMSRMPETLSRVRPDLDLPDGIEAIVLRALAKDPLNRYQTVGDLADDLRASLQGAPVKRHRQLPTEKIAAKHDTALRQGQDGGAQSAIVLPSLIDIDAKVKALLMEELEPGETVVWAGSQQYATPGWVKNLMIWVLAAVAVTILLAFLFHEWTILVANIFIVGFGAFLPSIFLFDASQVALNALLCFTDRRFLLMRLNIPVHNDGVSRVQKPQAVAVLSIDYAATKSMEIRQERKNAGELAFHAKTRFAGTGQTDDSVFAVDYVPKPHEICKLISSYVQIQEPDQPKQSN